MVRRERRLSDTWYCCTATCWVGLLVLTVVGQVADAEVICKLHLECFGHQQGLKKAHLSCTGGSIKAVAHPLFAPLVGAKAGVQSAGVQWLDNGSPWRLDDCLLAMLGGSKATFPSATVMHVNVTAVPKIGTKLLLCLTGNSSVTFAAAIFDRNFLIISGYH